MAKNVTRRAPELVPFNCFSALHRLNLNALHRAAAKDPSLLHHELLGLPGEHLPVLPVLLQLAQHLVHPLDKELDIINGCSNSSSCSKVSLAAVGSVGTPTIKVDTT